MKTKFPWENYNYLCHNQQGPRRNSTKPIPKILHLPILTPQRQVQYLFFYQLILSFREPAFQYIIHF